MEWRFWLIAVLGILAVIAVSALVTQARRRRGGAMAERRTPPPDGGGERRWRSLVRVGDVVGRPVVILHGDAARSRTLYRMRPTAG